MLPQTILQYFYKLLICSILIGSHLSLPLTSYFDLSITTPYISSL